GVHPVDADDTRGSNFDRADVDEADGAGQAALVVGEAGRVTTHPQKRAVEGGHVGQGRPAVVGECAQVEVEAGGEVTVVRAEREAGVAAEGAGCDVHSTRAANVADGDGIAGNDRAFDVDGSGAVGELHGRPSAGAVGDDGAVLNRNRRVERV